MSAWRWLKAASMKLPGTTARAEKSIRSAIAAGSMAWRWAAACCASVKAALKIASCGWVFAIGDDETMAVERVSVQISCMNKSGAVLMGYAVTLWGVSGVNGGNHQATPLMRYGTSSAQSPRG